MRKLFAVVLLGFCFVLPVAYAGGHNFQTGRLIQVTTDERLHEGTTLRRAIFTVQIGDIVYTLQGYRAVPPKARDYAEGLIVGDPVQASVEGERVVLRRPNGKDFKTSILKRERAQPR
jgi:hypothetical protein